MTLTLAAKTLATTTSTILMVPPEGFQFNPQTAQSNAYQHKTLAINFQEKALAEFNAMVAKLRANGVTVITLSQDKSLPDAVFPNNWFSTHPNANGKTTVILYPMLTPNRQAEVNPDGLLKSLSEANIEINKVIDLRNAEGNALEGTGSMILDRENKIIYASLSPRTSASMLDKAAKLLDFNLVKFHSVDQQQNSIYHTNIMMCIAKHYAIVCLECIPDLNERTEVINHLKSTNKLIISLTQEQIKNMCGNTIELTNNKHESLLVMSQQAYQHFTADQLTTIEKYSRILPMDIKTIETIGGGSTRCMIAEIF